jgi:hypothetical protein
MTLRRPDASSGCKGLVTVVALVSSTALIAFDAPR